MRALVTVLGFLAVVGFVGFALYLAERASLNDREPRG
jgi:preprotein translocase subunit Sss1